MVVYPNGYVFRLQMWKQRTLDWLIAGYHIFYNFNLQLCDQISRACQAFENALGIQVKNLGYLMAELNWDLKRQIDNLGGLYFAQLCNKWSQCGIPHNCKQSCYFTVTLRQSISLLSKKYKWRRHKCMRKILGSL
jgi:hypothetical protein